MGDLRRHASLKLLNRPLYRRNVHLLGCRLGHLRLKNHALLFKLLCDCHALFAQILFYHGDAVITILVHEHR